jgi:hypothetical protein
VEQPVRFAMLNSGVAVQPSVSAVNREQIARNEAVTRRIPIEEGYRVPWQDVDELHQFRAEIGEAVAAHPEGFALRRPAAPAARHWWRLGWPRLFRARS